MLLHYQLKKLRDQQAKEAEMVDVVVETLIEEDKKPTPKKKTNTKK